MLDRIKKFLRGDRYEEVQGSDVSGKTADAVNGAGQPNQQPDSTVAPKDTTPDGIHSFLFRVRRHSYCLSLPLCLEWYNRSIRAKLHYTDTDYGHVVQHHQQTPPTDELTTILQQICHIAMPEPNISTC